MPREAAPQAFFFPPRCAIDQRASGRLAASDPRGRPTAQALAWESRIRREAEPAFVQSPETALPQSLSARSAAALTLYLSAWPAFP